MPMEGFMDQNKLSEPNLAWALITRCSDDSDEQRNGSCLQNPRFPRVHLT
jgi:hypothetical protein